MEVNNNYLVYENGELKPKYTLREKYSKIIFACVADLELALKIREERKDLEIFDESLKAIVFENN